MVLSAEAEGHAATHLRYIVLGAKEKLDLNSRSRPLGIFVQQRSWDDVSASCPRSPLVQDLFETFGDLGINPFYLEKVKTICVKTGMREARDAWEVLKAVCQDVLDAHPSALKPDGEIRRSGSYGLYINQPPPQRSSKNHRLLKAATSSAGNLAWLGYEFDDAGDVHKSIWFHSENPKKREHLFAKVTKSFPRSEKTQVGGDLFVIVLPNDDDQHNDFEWFERALGCAIA